MEVCNKEKYAILKSVETFSFVTMTIREKLKNKNSSGIRGNRVGNGFTKLLSDDAADYSRYRNQIGVRYLV